MGFFDTKWIVEIEYSDGFFKATKKDTVIVEAKNDYAAKEKVKNDPLYKHEYFRICSVKRYDPQPNVSEQETIKIEKPLSPQEREKLDKEILLSEQRFEEEKRQKAISAQKDKINLINKSPTIVGVISGILTSIAFLVGWIPYWYWDFRRESFRRIVEDLYAKDKTLEDPFAQEMFLEGVHAKEMRNSVIWIPFVILSIGIVITIVVVILTNKSKPKRLVKAQEILNELKQR